MKTNKKQKRQANFEVNEEDLEIMEILRTKYAINISQLFKNSLKTQLEKLEKLED